tara:strand:- start:433 stop:1284 length:852 start_codon:yes stop_codon:yes gene_type:complete
LTPTDKYIQANGITQHYLDWGNPGAPPLLMIHATGLCAHVWNPYAQKLSASFHVICLNQRGHGYTDQPTGEYDFELVGQDVAAFIEELNLTNLHGIGHSSGGLVTLMASHMLPGRYSKIALTETTLRNRSSMITPEQLESRLNRTRSKRLVWESRDAIYEAYRHRNAFKNWCEESFEGYLDGGTKTLEGGQVQLLCPPAVEAHYYQTRYGMEVDKYFTGLKGKYLLLLGNYDGGQIADDPAILRWIDTAEDARVKAMGIGSHFLPLEFPEETLAVVSEFLLEN